MLLITAAKLLLALASFQDPTPQSPGPMMWTGQANNIARPTDKDAAGYSDALRAELKALVTRTDVQRDYPVQLEALDLLRGRACWSPAYPGKADIAAEIAEVRADWLEKLGRHSDAIYAAHNALVMPTEKDVSPFNRFVWVSSNGLLAPLVNEIDALPRMAELHKRFPSNEPATKGGDAIEDAVRKEIEQGEPRNLKNFGARCAPALRKVLSEQPEQLSQRLPASADPLLILLTVDRNSGLSFILSTLGKRGPIWTIRVIARLRELGLTGGTAWVINPAPYTPPRFGDPLTLSVIDALASESMSAQGYFALLESLVGNDVVTPAIQSFLLGQVQATDPEILAPLRRMLDGGRIGPNKRVLYEAFLDSPDPELRARCAEALSNYSVGPATLRAAQHSDPNVRSAALRALVRHRVGAYDYQRDQMAENKKNPWREVTRTPEIEAALLKLARDPERSVRVALIKSLQNSLEEPPAEVLGALLADTDPDVRQAAAFDWSFKPELQVRILERLAGDQDPTVLRAVGYALNKRSPASNQDFQEQFPPYLPALAKWLTNPATNLASEPNAGPRNPIEGALLTPSGARSIFDACASSPARDTLLNLLAECGTWATGNPRNPPLFKTLDSTAVAELFARKCATNAAPPLDNFENIVAQAVIEGFDAAGFLALARDAGHPLETRLRAFSIAASRTGAGEKELVFSFLREAKPEALWTSEPTRVRLRRFMYAVLTWPPIAQYVPEICADSRIPDGVALSVAAEARQKGPSSFDAATTRACLERWQRLDADWKQTDNELLGLLDPRVDPAVIELWKRELHDGRLSAVVVRGMRNFPVDDCIPLLIDAITGDWSSVQDSFERVRRPAVLALTERLDDLGADALLKAIASTTNESARKACFDGLEQIRKYQDEKQSWQKRKGGEAAREQAIADLLPMLADKDALTRAAAARSLATLQAIEHLPKLVALLKDKDASVREAAQKALDALNTPAPKKP
jgi:HEAT repeat protein